MAVSDTTLEEIKSHIRIEEVIGDFVTLQSKRGSQNLWACCPFPAHNERTPSFSVHPGKGIYKCFGVGCGEAGDAISFLIKIKGFSYLEAMQYLAGKYQIAWVTQENDEVAQAAHLHKESLWLLMGAAQTYYQQCLSANEAAQTYLASRGITSDLIERFGLGYSLDAWRAWYDYATNQGHQVSLLEEVGLIIQKEHTTYDRFRNRLMFPIHNTFGRVIGFGGRQHIPDKHSPKYLNSPETVIYKKGEVLYGLYQAKEAIRQEQNCYLVEGYTDVLAMVGAGIPNVVATAGTAFTVQQSHLLKRFTKRITLLFDGDEAGAQAELKSINLLLEEGFDIKIVPLPDNEDPASYRQKKGSGTLKRHVVEEAQDFVTFCIQQLLAGKKHDPQQKTAVIHTILNSIARIPDPIQQDVYLDLCSRLLHMNKALLSSTLQEIHNRQQDLQHRPSARSTPASAKKWFIKEEATILSLLLNYGAEEIALNTSLAAYCFDELQKVTFVDPAYQQLYTLIEETWHTRGKWELSRFVQGQPASLQKKISDLLLLDTSWYFDLSSKVYTKNQLCQLVLRNIYRLKLTKVRKLKKEIEEQLTPTQEENFIAQQLEVHQVLKKIEQEIADKLGITTFSTRTSSVLGGNTQTPIQEKELDP